MDADENLLAEFYYYTVGDKTTYNQGLNDLHVCYTLARGLQVHSNKQPRRPTLPLEIILRIIRHAGFVDAKPDLTLSSEVILPVLMMHSSKRRPSFRYIAGPLSRVQLASMAHMQLVSILKNPKPQIMPHAVYDTPPTLWNWIEQKVDGEERPFTSLQVCANKAKGRAVQPIPNAVDYSFGPNHEIHRELDGGRHPCVLVILKEPARLIVWKWWEPKF